VDDAELIAELKLMVT